MAGSQSICLSLTVSSSVSARSDPTFSKLVLFGNFVPPPIWVDEFSAARPSTEAPGRNSRVILRFRSSGVIISLGLHGLCCPCKSYFSKINTFCQRTWTGGGPRRTHGLIPKPFAAPAKAYKFGRKFLVSCAKKSPDDFPAEGKDESEEGQFVAPRVTPDYVGKDSIKPPPRVVKNIEGPWITRWGGNVRGGKYQMGQGTDRIIDIFANGNAMLIAAGGLIVLFFVLLQFRPDAPPPPPPS
ncbi:unnamed protein product [Calypogeia fissa]